MSDANLSSPAMGFAVAFLFVILEEDLRLPLLLPFLVGHPPLSPRLKVPQGSSLGSLRDSYGRGFTLLAPVPIQTART
jgi:hypothetical protein